jgi:hypothetical protein
MAALHGLKGDTLDLILHSPGGSGSGAAQIVEYLRNKYDRIRAIVPQKAMSAATMIACGCDVIIMGKHSSIGPIDPQVTVYAPDNPRAVAVSAHSILNEIKRAKEEMATNRASVPFWMQRLRMIPPGYLEQCRYAIEASTAQVEEWLGKYMFCGDPHGKRKAKEIAEWLGNADDHKSHEKPIMAQLAASKNLKIESIEEDAKFQEIVISLYHLISLTFEFTNCVKMTENHNGKGAFVIAKVNR